MRVVSTLSVFVACLVALTGCGPSRQDYSYYDEGDRYEDRYERARAAREKKRKARKVRQSSARQHAPMTAPRATQSSRRETAEVAIDPEPVRAPPAAAEQVRAQPVARPPAVAPAVPPVAAAAAPVDEAAAKVAQKQISDGYRLLRAGFVKKAREKFELAMKADAPAVIDVVSFFGHRFD